MMASMKRGESIVRPGICLIVIALAAPVAAHDTWLLPTTFEVRPGAKVDLAMTSGMTFPQNETPVSPDRIAQTGVRAGGSKGELRVEGTRDGALHLSAVLTREGVAALWAVSRPRTLDLAADEVTHYLEEIGQGETVGKAWAARGRPAWRETYSKTAKTFVRAGASGPRLSWEEPAGLQFELVPGSDPTSLKAGDTLVLRLLWEGRAIATVPVAAVGPDAKPQMRRPEAEGRVSFTVSAPGLWLFKATRLVEGASRNEWESQFTTLTIEARP